MLPSFASRMGPYNALPDDRLLDEQTPVLIGSIRGQQLALVRPERLHGGPIRTIPITMDRLQRDYDLRRGYAPGPFVESLSGVTDGLPHWLIITAGFVAIGFAMDYMRAPD